MKIDNYSINPLTGEKYIIPLKGDKEKIDDFYATIGRQSFFTLFEISAHQQIANSTTVDEISKTYLHNLNEQFGSSVNVSEDFQTEWSCIPHFYHAPFYCYSYAISYTVLYITIILFVYLSVE